MSMATEPEILAENVLLKVCLGVIEINDAVIKSDMAIINADKTAN